MARTPRAACATGRTEGVARTTRASAAARTSEPRRALLGTSRRAFRRHPAADRAAAPDARRGGPRGRRMAERDNKVDGHRFLAWIDHGSPPREGHAPDASLVRLDGEATAHRAGSRRAADQDGGARRRSRRAPAGRDHGLQRAPERARRQERRGRRVLRVRPLVPRRLRPPRRRRRDRKSALRDVWPASAYPFGSTITCSGTGPPSTTPP